MLDVIAAPEVDEEARSILTSRKNTKLFINRFLYFPELRSQVWDYRFVRGGVIRQSIADFVLDISELDWNTKNLPENTNASLILANSGVVSGMVPSGGRHQDEVQDFFNKKNISIGFIPDRFRGFCRH